MFASLLKGVAIGVGMKIAKELLSNKEAESDQKKKITPQERDEVEEEEEEEEDIYTNDAINEMKLKIQIEKHRIKMEAERQRAEAKRQKAEEIRRNQEKGLIALGGLLGVLLLIGAVTWLAQRMFLLIGLLVAIFVCVMTWIVLRHKRMTRQQNIDVLKTNVSKIGDDEAERRAKEYQEK